MNRKIGITFGMRECCLSKDFTSYQKMELYEGLFFLFMMLYFALWMIGHMSVAGDARWSRMLLFATGDYVAVVSASVIHRTQLFVLL